MKLHSFWEVWIFFLPALIANGAAPVGKTIPYFSRLYSPIFPSLLGAHKTWGGSLAALLVGGVTGLLISPIFSSLLPSILTGFLLGFGACLGDILGSLFKRRLEYKEGKFIWFDWVDWLVGTWLVSFFLIKFNLVVVLTSSSLVVIVIIVDLFSVHFTSFKKSL